MTVSTCTPIRAAAYLASLIVLLLGATHSAAAQQPSEAQGAAIRSACRSDYRSHCASVPTGGPAALQCLQKNVASLSASCQQAVNAVGGAPATPAAPAASAKPVTPAPAAAAAPAPAPTATTPQAAPAEPVAATPAAPAPTVAATPAAPAKSAMTKPPSKAPAAAGKPAASSVAASAPPAAAPAPPPVIRTVTPRQVLALLRTACGPDFRAHCPGVAMGGGRVIGCLQANAAALSPTCQDALQALAR
jgi:hypothetical protein